MSNTFESRRDILPALVELNIHEKLSVLIRSQLLHRMTLGSPAALVCDVEQHLRDTRADLLQTYPIPYLRWVIADSVALASRFRIDDVYSMRLFVRLRWEIAPGFYRQAELAHVLEQIDRSAEERFAELATHAFADAWTDARRFNEPAEWRERFWEPAP